MQRRGRIKRIIGRIEPDHARPAVRTPAARFDVVALVTSAGGLEALAAVLSDLPTEFPAAVIVAQHLGGQGSALVEILSRRTTLPVTWASTGARLTPGQVLVCPPRRQLEILPDGTCAVGGEITARDKPHDLLLESIADSCGSRALAVVLTGMGKDAAGGAAAMKRAGGIVLVQSVETSEQPSMPRSTVASGAFDLVLPLREIAAVLASVVAGGDLPRPRSEVEAAEALFAGESEVPRLLRAMDWSRTSLGPVAGWPISLRTTLRLVLDSKMAMSVLWGPDLIQLYNDAYRLIMGPRHPAALGQPSRLGFPEAWHLNQPIYRQVLAGESVTLTDALYPITRRNTPEDAWLDLSFTPVRDETGTVAGVHATVVETTARVLSKRRLRTLHALTAATAGATLVQVAMQRALAVLAGSGRDSAAQDVPFALVYLVDERSRQAQLGASVGVDAGGPMAPRTIDLRAARSAWPLTKVLAGEGERSPLLLEELTSRFPGSQSGPTAQQAPTAALLLPLCPVAEEPPAGVLVCGINPRLVLDEIYRGFLELVAAAVSAALAEAEVRQKEHVRLERLAELDRAKTEFFSNVSHEFRTPLTLLLGPLEELSRRQGQLPQPLGQEVQVATRNARRLLNQVNTLLDFSQAESQRMRPRFEPTDLAALTRDIASVFRSAAQRGGLAFRVQCPPLAEPVWVDPQMWEKIVSNLLSNALKFTLTGQVAVELKGLARHVELIVSDTGVGIPADEQANVFKRFHRVRGRRGRTSEGSGIGLALVYELVRLHHGRIRLRSEEGQGSTFTVWVPLGRRVQAEPGIDPTALGPAAGPVHAPEVAAALAEEAAGWDNATTADGYGHAQPHDVADDLLGPPMPPAVDGGPARRARVLVVDDNVDLRDYLGRMLRRRWDVALAADGPAALAELARERPDAVLADVMMPGLDGFELLERIRSDPALKYVPVLLVTARAGEKAAIEGLRAGADDYISKPFSSRELVARVESVIERSRVEAALRERAAWVRGQREALESAVDGASLATSLGVLVRTTVETLGEGTRAAFYLADDEGTSLYHVVGMPDDYAEAVNGFKIGPDSLACGLDTAIGKAVLTTDVMTDPLWEPWRWMAQRFDYRGCWSFPIHTPAGRFVGTLAVYSREPREATARELELASLLTQTASIILSRQAESKARQEAEKALRATEARLLAELADARRLQQVSGLLIDPGDDAALPVQILDAAVALAGADFGSVQQMDDAGQLDLVASKNFTPQAIEQWRKVALDSATTCGSALGRGERVIVADVETDAAEALIGSEGAGQYRQFGVRAVQSTPLITREGRLVGMLSTHWRAAHTPGERELRLLDILARQAADFFERRRTLETMRASEERRRESAQVPGVGVLTFDEATGALIDANQTFLAMSGYTREQVERREITWQAMTPPEHIAASEEQWQKLGQTGRIGPYEKEYFRADGSRTWMLFAGASTGDGRIVEYCLELAEPGGGEYANGGEG